MLRLVLDTNVLVSGLLNPSGIPGKLLEGLLESRWKLLLSPEILDEYEAVLTRPKFGFQIKAVHEMTGRLRQAASPVQPRENPKACSDPTDDKFLACCLEGNGDCLVTGNTRHFPRSPFRGVRILTPAEFVKEFV